MKFEALAADLLVGVAPMALRRDLLSAKELVEELSRRNAEIDPVWRMARLHAGAGELDRAEELLHDTVILTNPHWDRLFGAREIALILESELQS